MAEMLIWQKHRHLIFAIVTALLLYLSIISYKILICLLCFFPIILIMLLAIYGYGRMKHVSSQKVENAIIILLIAIFFLFYLWTASTSYGLGKMSFRFGSAEEDPYNLLSDALIKGSLSLLVRPSQGLLSLSDPYDPAENGVYRLEGAHDLSLYKGKFYVYFGAVPALVMFIPFSLLFGYDMPGNLALALFCIGGTVWSLLIFKALAEKFFPELPLGLKIFSISLLCVCNMCLYNLRRPLMYEIAIASGFFFFAGGLYLLILNYLNDNKNYLQIAAGSLFTGLAAGSRPTIALAGIVLVIFLFHIISGKKGLIEIFKMDTLKKALPVLLPFLFCIAAMCAYNYMRFGSLTEFGLSYQLTGMKLEDRIAVSRSPQMILYSLKNFFFLPVIIDGTFPFFHCSRYFFINYYERVSGLLPLMPFVFILLFLPASYSTNNNESGRKFYTVTVLAFALGMLLLLSCCFIGCTQRFFGDFMFLLITASLLVFLTVVHNDKYSLFFRRMLIFSMIAASVYSMTANLAISLEGDSDLLNYLNPDIYNSIRRFFLH